MNKYVNIYEMKKDKYKYPKKKFTISIYKQRLNSVLPWFSTYDTSRKVNMLDYYHWPQWIYDNHNALSSLSPLNDRGYLIPPWFCPVDMLPFKKKVVGNLYVRDPTRVAIVSPHDLICPWDIWMVL